MKQEAAEYTSVIMPVWSPSTSSYRWAFSGVRLQLLKIHFTIFGKLVGKLYFRKSSMFSKPYEREYWAAFSWSLKKKKKVVLECKLLCKCSGRTLQRPRPAADTSDKIHTSTRPALQNHWVPSTHGGFSQVTWSQMPWRAQKYRCKHSFEVTERNSSCVSLTTDLAPFATRITAVKTFISNLQFL